MGILKELYYGNVAPCEREVDPASEEGFLMEALCYAEEDLLNEENKTAVEAFEALQADLTLLESETAWINGFRLGTQFMLELLMKKA